VVSSGGQIIYARKGKVAYFTIDSPERMNAVTLEMNQQRDTYLADFMDDPTLWVGILTGSGDRAFSAGGDIKRHNAQRDEKFSMAAAIKRFWYPRTEPISPYASAGAAPAKDIFKPMIGAVNGYCIEGGLLKLTTLTDIRIAAEHATFGFTGHKRGLGTSGAVRSRITHQIPYAVAMEMLLLGDLIDAREAYRIGLVNKVVPQSELMATAEDYARRICEMPPLTIRAIKESVVREWRGEIPSSFLGRYTQNLAAMVTGSQDFEEGLSTFVEKRKPVYRGE
jgi:enoyl-CoA hydratase/carnithine racemase